jgi:Sec-independent protein translocase protein TatA
MQDINLVAILVAVLGAGGLGAFAREIADVVTKLRNGVSARESKRKNDIITQRDAAVAERNAANKRADAAEGRTDRERENRRRMEVHAARLQRHLILVGEVPDEWPEIDETTEITNP